MKSKNRTAIEKAWHEAVCRWCEGSHFTYSKYAGYCDQPNIVDLHHIWGAQKKLKINLVSVKVGEFLVMPVPKGLHSIMSNNPLNVTTHKKAFESQFGRQVDIWHEMVIGMRESGYELPFDDDLIKEIMK